MSLSSPLRPRRRPRVRPGLESLEHRALLSTVPPFASFEGRVEGPWGDPIAARVGAADFGLAPGGRVLLRIEATAAGDGTLDPGPTSVVSGSPLGAWTLTRQVRVGGGATSVTVASARPGDFSMVPTARGGTSGDVSLNVSLAGDVLGDGRVAREDLDAIRSLLGRRADASGVPAGADVNGDGWVGLIDLLIASRNLGASTTIEPLDVSVGIDPEADPEGDGRVEAEEVDLVGRASPGATVRIDVGADGSIDQEVVAGDDGSYRVTVPLQIGSNPIAIEASDGFGQGAEASLTIVRGSSHELPPVVSASFDFSLGDEGWEAGFTDLPVDPNEFFELDSGLRPLPSELGEDGTGYLLQSHNRSDDVFMFLKRGLGQEDGIVAGQSYEAKFTITLASNAPSGGFGIGGAPGESVFLKAGAGPVEPVPVDEDGFTMINVDKGNQGSGGPAASVAGNIANGEDPVEPGDDQPYASVTVEHVHEFPAVAGADGTLWLLVGTDSGFEGLTALYYQRIDVTLTPIDG